MEKVNRKKQQALHSIKKIEMLKAEKINLANGIPLYLLNSGEQDIVKLDFIFPAGHWFQPAPFISSAVCAMLTEGTHKYTSRQIAEKLEYYGATLSVYADKDFTFMSLFCLTKHLPCLFEIIEDILLNSIFPENEFNNYIQRKHQQLLIEYEKIMTLSRIKFNNVLFGDSHPYGIMPEINNLFDVTVEKLKRFYIEHYNILNCKIIAAGKIGHNLTGLINNFFGKTGSVKTNHLNTFEPKAIYSSAQKQHIVSKENVLQSAVRMGTILFNKLNPDYPGMQVLNTLLGGYFGSRLMSNIREDKGYTYGINSVIYSTRNAGYFGIISEVRAEVCKNAIKEIYFELNRLRTEPTPREELKRVKNFILGEMQRMFDGPLALSESLWAILEYDLDYDYFSRFIDVVKHITPIELQILANKYLQEESMYEVIAGRYD